VRGPVVLLVALQLLPLPLQSLQLYDVGALVQDALIVIVCPTCGVRVGVASVHTGGCPTGCCQLTSTVAGVLDPAVLAATTVYRFGPATLAES